MSFFFFPLRLAQALCTIGPVGECLDLENLPIKMPGDISGLVKDLLSGPKMNSSHTFLLSVFSSSLFVIMLSLGGFNMKVD